MIPGFLISWLTFPGVIVHETAHMLFCRLRGVAVFDVCFFRFANPSGYVVHEIPKDFTTAFLISVGPLLVNSLLCMLICFPVYLPTRIYGVNHPLSYVLLWLGISIGMNAFPSIPDADNLFKQARQALRSMNPLAILSVPLVGLIYAANLLSFFWLDYLYGLAIGLWLPSLIF
jgi:hypothetical protein